MVRVIAQTGNPGQSAKSGRSRPLLLTAALTAHPSPEYSPIDGPASQIPSERACASPLLPPPTRSHFLFHSGRLVTTPSITTPRPSSLSASICCPPATLIRYHSPCSWGGFSGSHEFEEPTACAIVAEPAPSFTHRRSDRGLLTYATDRNKPRNFPTRNCTYRVCTRYFFPHVTAIGTECWPAFLPSRTSSVLFPLARSQRRPVYMCLPPSDMMRAGDGKCVFFAQARRGKK